MSTLITKSQVVDTLRVLVAEHGAGTIRDNTYTRTTPEATVPWCIAGCALHAWGFSIMALIAIEGTCINEVALSWPLEGIELTEAATAVLHIAQDSQDGGATWGNVLGAALDAAEGWGDEE